MNIHLYNLQQEPKSVWYVKLEGTQTLLVEYKQFALKNTTWYFLTIFEWREIAVIYKKKKITGEAYNEIKVHLTWHIKDISYSNYNSCVYLLKDVMKHKFIG